jgi:hypothetical protein
MLEPIRNGSISLWKTNLENNLSEEILAGRPDPIEENRGMNGSEEGSIQPASRTLPLTVKNLFAERDIVTYRRRCEMNSGTVVGTSVDALALLTYFKVQASRFLVTISKQRIRSSARYMLRSKKTKFSLIGIPSTWY